MLRKFQQNLEMALTILTFLTPSPCLMHLLILNIKKPTVSKGFYIAPYLIIWFREISLTPGAILTMDCTLKS